MPTSGPGVTGVTDAGRGTEAGQAALSSTREGVGPSEAGTVASAGLLLAPPSLGSQATSSTAPDGAREGSPEGGVHDQRGPGRVQDGSLPPGCCRRTDVGVGTGAHGRLLEGGGGAAQAGSGMIEGTSTATTSLRLDGSGRSLDMGAAAPCQLPHPQQAPRSAAGGSSAAAPPEGDTPGPLDATWQQAHAPAEPPAVVESGQPPAASAADPALRRPSLGSDAAAAATSVWGQGSSGTGAPSGRAAAAGWAEGGKAGASSPGLSAASAGAGTRSGQAAAVIEEAAASALWVSAADSAAGSNHGHASAGSSGEPESSGMFTQRSVAHLQSTAFMLGDPSQQPPTRWQSTASSLGDAGARSAPVLTEQDFRRLAHQPQSCDQSAAASQQLPVLYQQRTLSSSSQGSALRSEGQAADSSGALQGWQDSARWAQRSPTRYQSAVSAFGDAMEGPSAVPGGQTVAPSAGEADTGFDSRQALQAAAAETALTLGLCDGWSKQREGPACPPEQAAPVSLQQSRAGTEPQPAAESVHGQRQDSAACLQAAQDELPAPQQGSEQSDTSQADQRSSPQEAARQAVSRDSQSPAAAARSPELAALLARAAAFCDRAPQQNLFRCACSALFTCCP